MSVSKLSLNLRHFFTGSLSPISKIGKISNTAALQLSRPFSASKNFSFQNSQNSNRRNKKIVVIFAWLYSSDRHLDKYRKLYLNQGIDVFTVKPTLADVLFTKFGCQRIARKTVLFLTENNRNYQSCWFHSFSVGTYQMAEVFKALNRTDDETQAFIQSTLKGLVLDSPDTAITPAQTAKCLALASSQNAVIQSMIFQTLKFYFTFFQWLAFEHYLRAFRVLDEHRLKCPVLIFSSKNEIIGDYKHFERIAQKWTKEGVHVTTKFWDNSFHVKHYLKYPDEYRKCLEAFVNYN